MYFTILIHLWLCKQMVHKMMGTDWDLSILYLTLYAVARATMVDRAIQ
jgi:hypothetical protein